MKFSLDCLFKHPLSVSTLIFDFILDRFYYIVIENRETPKYRWLQRLYIFYHLFSHLFLAYSSALALSQETQLEAKNNRKAKNDMFLNVTKWNIRKIGILLVELVAVKIIIRKPA